MWQADTKDIVKMEMNYTNMDMDTIYTEQSLQILRIPDGVQKRPILSSRDIFSITDVKTDDYDPEPPCPEEDCSPSCFRHKINCVNKSKIRPMRQVKGKEDFTSWKNRG